MGTSTSFRCFGVLFYLATVVGASAQTAASSPEIVALSASSGSTTLLTFQQGQQALDQTLSALLAQNPTPQQLQAWQQQNSTALANQQQLALNLADEAAVQPLPPVSAPNIPTGASPALATLITAQVTLANARAQIHNQLLNALPLDVSDAQISQMEQNEEQLFQQQNAATIQARQQAVQELTAESAQEPAPLPPPLIIPSGATSQMQAFLTLQDQLTRAQIQLHNQNLSLSAAAQDAALQQWKQQNAASFQQLQQLALSLSATTGK